VKNYVTDILVLILNSVPELKASTRQTYYQVSFQKLYFGKSVRVRVSERERERKQ